MASSLAFRRAANASSPLLKKFVSNVSSVHLRPLAAAPTAARSFNTNADHVTASDDGERRPETAVYRRRDPFPSLFSDVFDPFSPTRTVGQLMSMMDQFMADPVFGSRGAGPAAVSRRGWDLKEDENALSIKMDMPGVDKENVKVTVEENTLMIRGEGEKESEEEETRRKYSSNILLPPSQYKLDEIKAEMRNGVLRVNVPKVKEEERKEVKQVMVE